MKTKDFKFDLKAVAEDGTFEGYLSVFGVVDLGNDLVEPGAFTKTIKDQKGVVPMLWQHDTKQPIGSLTLTQDDVGLKVKGALVLGVKQAQETYELLKAGVIRGLSIGYDAVQKEWVKGVRHLKELKLYEGSVVTFPMLPIAQIDLASVKAAGEAKDFNEELMRIQLYMMRDMLMRALCYSLDDILYDYDSAMDSAARVQASQESIDQFSAAYMEHLPKLLEMWGVKGVASESKAGRRISATSRTQIEEAITKLQALLTEEETTSTEAEPQAIPKAATHDPVEPEDPTHSLANFTSEVKDIFKWNN